jgi:K(+)-stimulated pyrophosphate-energized sodium pump
MSNSFLLFAPLGSAAALLFAGYMAFAVLRYGEGTKEMVGIASAIREGARAYLRRQYSGVAVFFAVTFVLLLLLARAGYIIIFVPFAFLSGGFFSGLAGFIGMSMATRSSARTAFAAKDSLNKALRVAFSSGSVMGLAVVGLGLLDLSFWYHFLNWYYRAMEPSVRVQLISSAMLMFGMGASAMALFARVGGGIFTKAADVGADLVGKVEQQIPEDDPRNPAVIADNVGDNVGDVAGMGADLYESYVGSIIASAALAVAAGLGGNGIAVPLGIAATGVVASIIGTFFVHAREGASQAGLLMALRRGVYTSSFIVAIVAFVLVRSLLGTENLGVFAAIMLGLFAGNLIGYFTEYYTSASYKPTLEVAANSQTGAATVIIGGMAVGMLSTAIPVLTVGVTILASFLLTGGLHNYSLGLYGVGVAAIGMLSTLGITLATDAYGPVADNAGGIAQMADMPPEVRERTDALDSLGNTTAATGKGFAIGSAALTALALIAAYRDHVEKIVSERNLQVVFDFSILNPQVLVGLFIGAMLPFVFCALAMSAVGHAAQKVVVEVRRQFREIKGLADGSARADYSSCVDICTRSAQREMLPPTLVGIAAPIVVGLILGIDGVMGLLAGTTATGFVLAIFMANAGGSWDNAKKYTEAGAYGGKGSSAHVAAVVGDTVGDPFKDTAGPSLNILIKLVSMVSIVFAAFILTHSLM